MKKDIGRTPRKKIFAELETSHQLGRYLGSILENENDDRCGVLISGYSGTGKTSIVENYLKQLDARYPVLIARHYQQHEKIPYFGFTSAISDYLSKIYNQFSEKEFAHFSGKMKDHLGGSFPLLLDYIPELSFIVTETSGFSQRSMLAIENQLYPLFKTLFEFLADCSRKPIFFFTDDLQWMDASGANLLKYLLLNLTTKKLIWIAACRSPVTNINFLRQLDEELAFNKRRIENMVLKGFTVSEAGDFLAVKLGGNCHPDLANVCYKLSGGNPSHLQLLVESLKTSGLLRSEAGIWACDKDIVEIRYAGQNTEGILLAAMKELSPAAHQVISIMACMGRFNKTIILDWLDKDASLIEKLLQEAREAGILTNSQTDIHFSDMHIGEMIYSELEKDERVSIHYKIATLFYSRGLECLSATDFILMTANFNQSIDVLRAGGTLKMAAELNYEAGKILQQENALEQARYFFKMSADLLKECQWDEVSELILFVYMERARVEYVLGEYDLAEIHLDYLLERIPDPVKRAGIFELKVTINNHLGRYRKVVRILKESLSELGLELPLEEQMLNQEVRTLTHLLSQQEEAGYAEIPVVGLHIDSRRAILKLLYVGGMGLHHTSDVLMRWAALQIILCSGVESISGVKAIGCVSYGRMLIISGEIEKGFQFGLKGLKINDALQDVSLRCRVYGVYAFYIQPWKRPFADSYSLLDEAMQAGKKSGDLIGLYIIKTHRLNLHLISGLPLRDLPRLDFEEFNPGRELTYYITGYQISLLKFLTGESAVFEMPRQQPSWLAAELTIQEEKFYRNYVWARYYFLLGHYALAAWSAQEADNNRKLQEGSPLLPANLFIWFLSITQNWKNYPEVMRESLRVKLQAILTAFDLWQEQGTSNYTPSWYLLKADWFRINGHQEKAIEFYKRSADASGSNVFHAALTHELWAKYLLTIPGERDQACSHLSEAIIVYKRWGAVAKANQLARQYQAILPEPEGHPMPDQDMDIETIQYELSGDMEVSSLVKKLMVLLLRISGSTYVTVELVKDNGDRILKDELSLLPDLDEEPTAETTHAVSLPVSMILMALKSQNTIVINDLIAEKNSQSVEAMAARGCSIVSDTPCNH